MTLGGPCPGIRDGTQKRSPREVREIAEIGETRRWAVSVIVALPRFLRRARMSSGDHR
jgi:hypothetical protein